MKIKSIALKLFIWFLSITALAGSALSYLAYTNARNTLENEVATSLFAIASRQATQVNDYLVRKRELATSLASISEIITITNELAIPQPDEGTVPSLTGDILKRYCDSFGFSNLHVISPNGTILFSLKKAGEIGLNLNDKQFASNALAKLYQDVNIIQQTQLSDFEFQYGSKEPIAYVASPIKDKRTTIGLLILQFNNNEIDEVVNNYTGLGKSGEILLAKQQNGEIFLTSKTRHLADLAFQHKFDLSNTELPVIKAVSGKKGNGKGIDYRNKKVLAAWSYIPSLRNGVVVKIDQEEAFLPIIDLRNKLFIGLSISAFIISIVVLFVSRSISNPIRRLTVSTKRLAAGDLSVKNTIKDHTEIGALAKSFRQMATNIKDKQEQIEEYNRNLEAKVAARTQELEEQTRMAQEQSAEIAAQNEELHQQSEEIMAINSNLKDTQTELEELIADKEITNEELEKQQQELTHAMTELKEAQSQLVQSEKLSSLGQLTAGIAHEINNPINFVYAGANSLKNLLDEARELLNMYAKVSPETPADQIKEQLTQIEKFKKEIYFDDLNDDLNGLMADIITGAERTQAIVQSLRTFSRSDKDEFVSADLHANIDSTLVILQSQLSNRVNIHKDFESNLPFIECNINQINQVILNLINNAAQAIEEKGEIFIRTRQLTHDTLELIIKDTGQGMSPDTANKIFEPFFTTKAIGEGTGLGLSISHGIIEEHGGTIEVESKLGEGTSFRIVLPTRQQK